MGSFTIISVVFCRSRAVFLASLNRFAPRVNYKDMQYSSNVLTSSSDWLIALFTTVVVGQSNYFGFGTTTLMSIHLF